MDNKTEKKEINLTEGNIIAIHGAYTSRFKELLSLYQKHIDMAITEGILAGIPASQEVISKYRYL